MAMGDFRWWPMRWYWLADDGRVYASDRQIIIDQTDQSYQNFLSIGNVATTWPYDVNGAQTNASLQVVLDQHGLTIN